MMPVPSMRCELPPTGIAAQQAAGFARLVPVLRTERLILRAPRAADFPAYAGIACSPRGAGIGGPMTRPDAWWDFVQLASGWMLHGHGGWTAELAENGDVAGFICLCLEPGDPDIELGFLVTQAAEGKGLAYEGARAARAYAAEELALKTLVSCIAPDNARSIRLAVRLGARRDGEIADAGETTLIYRHDLGKVQ